MKAEIISRTKAFELIKNSGGKFFKVSFINKENETREMTCQYSKRETNPLGYVLVQDIVLRNKGEECLRNVNLNTLKTLNISKKNYKIRK